MKSSSDRLERKDDKNSEHGSESISSHHKDLVAENKQSLPSLFSRYAQGEKQSFYAQENSDRKKLPALNSTSEDLEYGEPEMIDSEQVASSLDPTPNDQIASSVSQKNLKDDHRIRGYRGSDISSSTTSRLHKFITKEVTEMGPNSRRENSVDENDLESMVLPSESISRAKTMKHSQDSSRSDRRSFEASPRIPVEDNARNEIDDSKELEPPLLRVEEEEREAKPATRKVVKPGSFPLPTNAPPRRARDALVEAEASQQKARRSIDEVLFKKESKDDPLQNSARNSVCDNHSSSEEEFDIKVLSHIYHFSSIIYFLS